MPIVTTEHAPYGTDPENLKGMKSRHYEGLIDLPRTMNQQAFPGLG